jgi:hypothetical protein
LSHTQLTGQDTPADLGPEFHVGEHSCLPLSGSWATLSVAGRRSGALHFSIGIHTGLPTGTNDIFQVVAAAPAHPVMGSFSTSSGNFGSSSTTFQAAGNLFGSFFQLALDSALVKVLMGKLGGGMIGHHGQMSGTESSSDESSSDTKSDN